MSTSSPSHHHRRPSASEASSPDRKGAATKDSRPSYMHRASVASNASSSSDTNGLLDHGNGNDSSRQSDDKKPSKRPREQYSCVECFRRKQKCDRRFPCNNCIKRRLPERCLPPASARAPIVQPGAPAPIIEQIKATSEAPTSPSPAKRIKREDDNWDDRKVEQLARTTSRLSRLERILALHDPSYVEQRLALAERAIQTRFGEDGPIRGNNEFRSHSALSRDSSYLPEENEQDRPGEGHLDDNEGFLGTSALEAVRLAPQLQEVSLSSLYSRTHPLTPAYPSCQKGHRQVSHRSLASSFTLLHPALCNQARIPDPVRRCSVYPCDVALKRPMRPLL